MTSQGPAPESGGMTPLSERQRGLVVALVVLGVGSAIGGLVVGLRMALRTTAVSCASGVGVCSTHRHAGEGTAIALLSLMAGILIVLAGIIARALPSKLPRRVPW